MRVSTVNPCDHRGNSTQSRQMNDQESAQVLDQDGYRKNVGMIVCNQKHQVLWARRVRRDGWQFPQGGVEPNESAGVAALRELYEEIGLKSANVRLLGNTKNWLRYDVPYNTRPTSEALDKTFRGQKQRWFLFELIAAESAIQLDLSDDPEFDRWQWVDYWLPMDEIVAFKRDVYKQALTELEPLLLR